MYVLMPYGSNVLGDYFGAVVSTIGCVVPILRIIPTYSGIGTVFSIWGSLQCREDNEGFTDILVWEGKGRPILSPFGVWQSFELELKKEGADCMHPGQFYRSRFWGNWSIWSLISWMCCWLSQAFHTWSSVLSLILWPGLCWFLWIESTKPGRTNPSAARGA